MKTGTGDCFERPGAFNAVPRDCFGPRGAGGGGGPMRRQTGPQARSLSLSLALSLSLSCCISSSPWRLSPLPKQLCYIVSMALSFNASYHVPSSLLLSPILLLATRLPILSPRPANRAIPSVLLGPRHAPFDGRRESRSLQRSDKFPSSLSLVYLAGGDAAEREARGEGRER